jgi:hypothetical protein
MLPFLRDTRVSVRGPHTNHENGKHVSADRSSDLEGLGSDESLSISSRGRAPKSDSDPHLAQPKAVCGAGLFSCCGSHLAEPGGVWWLRMLYWCIPTTNTFNFTLLGCSLLSNELLD